MERRFVSLVITSRVWTGDELLEHLGPADEPVETLGDPVGHPDGGRVLGWSSWAATSGLAETLDVEDHLTALHRRVRPMVDRMNSAGVAPVEAILRIVQYLPSNESQGHGFVVGSEWIELLAALNGGVDVDLYVDVDVTAGSGD